MVGPNNPASSREENQEQGVVSTSRKSLYELAQDAVSEKLDRQMYNPAELLKEVNGKDISAIARETKQIMLGLYQQSPGKYESIKDEAFIDTKISSSTIVDLYRRTLSSLRKEQDTLREIVIGSYDRGIFSEKTKDGKENQDILDEWIGELNEHDILHLRKSRVYREKMLRLKFGDRYENLKNTERKKEGTLKNLGINFEALSESQKSVLKKMGSANEYFDEDDARVFIDMIRDANAPIHDKREAIKELLSDIFPGGVDMRDAIRYGFIDEKEALRVTKEKIKKWMSDPEFFDHPDREIAEDREKWADRVAYDTDLSTVAIASIVSNEKNLDTFLEKDKYARPGFLEKNLTKKVEDEKSEDMREYKLTGGVNSLDDFKNKVEQLADKDTGQRKILGIGLMTGGSTLVLDQGGDRIYLRMEETDIELPGPNEVKKVGNETIAIPRRGVRVLDMTREGGIGPKGAGTIKTYSYQDLLETLSDGSVSRGEVIDGAELERRRGSDAGENSIQTIYHPEEDEIDSLDKLDKVVAFSPAVGMVLSLKGEDKRRFYIRIKNIDTTDNTITITDGMETRTVSYAQFARMYEDFDLTKKSEGGSPDITSLLSIVGLSGMKVKGGKLYKGEDEKIPVTHLKNAANEVIEIASISDNGVSYKYGKIKDNPDAKPSAKKPKLKGLSGLGQDIDMLQFLNFIEKENEGFEAYIPDSDEEKSIEPQSAHLHGNLIAKFMSGMSLNDMVKGFEIYKHAWEHKLEKNGKFNAAKFADKYLSGLMPETFRGQMKSEMYSVQNEAMEGIVKMLEETMNGKEARLYIRKKILTNTDARFEEVLAGLLYLGKKTGQLYSEELSDMRNEKLWFHQLARSMGYRSEASRKKLWDQAASKSPKGELATESDVIERVLKLWEGKEYRIPPNIAPKFAGYLAEGIKEQEEKGTKEVNMLSNIDQMNTYALSKLNVGEGYKAFGTLNRIFDKNGSAVQINTIPFTMVMSNMPETLGTEFGKRLHGQAVGEQARTSHALAFGNDINQAKKYRAMVREAAEELDRRGYHGALADLLKIEEKRGDIGWDSHKHEDTEDPQKKWVNSIYEYWKKHGEKLHPILQMTDPFIAANKEKKAVIGEYASRAGVISGMQRRRENTKQQEQFGEGNWKYNHTPPMDFKNLMYASAKYISSQNAKMDDSIYEQGFSPGVLGALNTLRNYSLKDFPGWTADDLRNFQRKTFNEWYATIIYYLRTSITHESFKRGAHEKNYIRDFAEHGIILTADDFRGSHKTRPSNIMDGEDEKAARNPLEIDVYDAGRIEAHFERFMNSSPANKRGVSARVRDTANRTQKVTEGSPIDYNEYGS